MLIVSMLICLLFAKLTYNNSERFDAVDKAYDDGLAVNLSEDVDSAVLADVLSQNYIENPQDVAFAVRFIKAKLNENGVPKALGDFQLRRWRVPVAEQGLAKYGLTMADMGEQMKARIASVRKYSLGAETDCPNLDSLKSQLSIDKTHSGQINVVVCAKNENESSLVSKIKSMLGREARVESVLVRLTEYGWDTLNGAPTYTRYYARTNGDGEAVFAGLNPSKSYSVLPIKEGKEYGSEKGTVGGSLEECGDANQLNCKFYEEEFCVGLFSNQQLSQIKSEGLITVRTPSMFLRQMWVYVGLFLLAWWVLYGIIRVKRRDADMGLVQLLMLMTGVCLCNMFSLNNPLVDKLIGVEMAQGVIVGIGLMCLLQRLDVIKLYQGQTKSGFDVPLSCFKWVFKPFRSKVRFLTEKMADKRAGVISKIIAVLLVVLCLPLLLLDLVRLTALSDKVDRALDRLPKGSGYLLLALLLTLLLFTPFGRAVGGMRVNLDLGIVFQPSEIAKYLIVLFMAAFFCTKAQGIVKYSAQGNAKLFGGKIKMMTMLIVGLGLLMMLYLALGDMGPAMVLAFTFIILYSIIKSKVDLEEVAEERKLSRILTCDVAMLLYGVLSFLALLYFCGKVWCLLWFVIWIAIGLFKKQIFESAILFNLVITAFLWGGDILGSFSSLESTAERLDSRTEMCTNTWGTLPVDGAIDDAGSNTQVANGLWAIASGGTFGQGFGKSMPSLVPAFHTDMILESMGEQVGFVGLFVLIVILALILRKVVVIGYRSMHPFTFYLCLGVTIVTAVQFIIISLGSTGVIPLTGVTVPLLSYGRVSMIINLLVFGLVLSIMSHTKYSGDESAELVQLKQRDMKKYEYSVSILSWMYCLVSLLVASVFFYYQVLAREDTLIRPVYVHTANGIPVVDYNPRIKLLTDRMKQGNIYDRNGVLLATSDVDELAKTEHKEKYESLGLEYNTFIPQKRYYPFGEHLYYMLGDFNTELYFGSDAGSRYPRGYMAESYHLSELRGYDNVKYDSNGKPQTIPLTSKKYAPGRYYAPTMERVEEITLRDYSKLIPFLKDGIYSSKVDRYNNRESRLWESDMIMPQDVTLTIDAVFQTRLQQKLEDYMSRNYKAARYNKTRASIVVLDARDGDLLASANYPKADYDVLRTNTANYYSDNRATSSFRPYSLEDLGLLYASHPGSSAKVISAMAGLKGMGLEATKQKYFVYKSQHTGVEPSDWVDMRCAIVESSNCFFINLINDKELYEPLSELYSAVGVTVRSNRAYSLGDRLEDDAKWRALVTDDSKQAIATYRKYIDKGSTDEMKKHTSWLLTWGQGDLAASPLAMARAVSAVANGGVMPDTRYTTKDEKTSVRLLDRGLAEPLYDYMVEEATVAKGFRVPCVIGGKTGTAERGWVSSRGKTEALNDAWFVCFVEREGSTPLAIAVRIERLDNGEMSGHAVRMTKNLVGPTLEECGLITAW